MTHSLHPDANAILTRLQQEGIDALYHFTDIENLPSICRMNAIHSKKSLEELGLLSTLATGGNALSHNLDRYHGNWDKVSLSFTPYTPMIYHRKRAQHLCFLLVSPAVATWSDVVFTDSNATKNDHIRGQGLTGLDNVHFDVMRALPLSVINWHRFVQAEALIPDSIPLTYITKVGFVSKASMEYAKHLCSSLPCPPFSEIPQLFTDSPRASSKTIGFSYVHDLIIEDTKVHKNMVYSTHIKENIFSKKVTNMLTLVATVKVMTGVQARISLTYTTTYEEQVIMSKELARSNEYKHKCSIPLQDLQVGTYLLKYYLEKVCWAVSSFEVIL